MVQFDLIRVCVFGRIDLDWRERVNLPGASSVEAAGFDIHLCSDDADLRRILIELRPQVIISLGQAESFQQLWSAPLEVRDRKSTRLNSSHANISYAVFCLKKKK